MIDDMFMRILAHEAILRSLVIKVADEHALTPELRSKWIKEVYDHIGMVHEASVKHAAGGKKHEVKEINDDMKPHLERFFKPMI